MSPPMILSQSPVQHKKASQVSVHPYQPLKKATFLSQGMLFEFGENSHHLMVMSYVVLMSHSKSWPFGGPSVTSTKAQHWCPGNHSAGDLLQL